VINPAVYDKDKVFKYVSANNAFLPRLSIIAVCWGWTAFSSFEQQRQVESVFICSCLLKVLTFLVVLVGFFRVNGLSLSKFLKINSDFLKNKCHLLG